MNPKVNLGWLGSWDEVVSNVGAEEAPEVEQPSLVPVLFLIPRAMVSAAKALLAARGPR